MTAELRPLGEPILASAPAVATSAVEMAPFGGVFVGFIALVIVLVVATARRERARRERLVAYALQHGWRPVPRGAPLPRPVVEAARSRRSKLVLGTRLQGFDVWLVWHQWTETTGSGDSTTQSTRNLTRYFAWPGHPYPDVHVGRRTRIGASLMPVRGLGTGDAEFDRRFLLRSQSAEAPGMLTAGLRQAMVAGDVPVWDIAGGVIITAHNDVPRIGNLRCGAGVIVHIVRMLADRMRRGLIEDRELIRAIARPVPAGGPAAPIGGHGTGGAGSECLLG